MKAVKTQAEAPDVEGPIYSSMAKISPDTDVDLRCCS